MARGVVWSLLVLVAAMIVGGATGVASYHIEAENQRGKQAEVSHEKPGIWWRIQPVEDAPHCPTEDSCVAELDFHNPDGSGPNGEYRVIVTEVVQ